MPSKFLHTRQLRNVDQPSLDAPVCSNLLRCLDCEFQQLFVADEERLALDARDVHSFGRFHRVELLRRLPCLAHVPTPRVRRNKPARRARQLSWHEVIELGGIRLVKNVTDKRRSCAS